MHKFTKLGFDVSEVRTKVYMIQAWVYVLHSNNVYLVLLHGRFGLMFWSLLLQVQI